MDTNFETESIDPIVDKYAQLFEFALADAQNLVFTSTEVTQQSSSSSHLLPPIRAQPQILSPFNHLSQKNISLRRKSCISPLDPGPISFMVPVQPSLLEEEID